MVSESGGEDFDTSSAAGLLMGGVVAPTFPMRKYYSFAIRFLSWHRGLMARPVSENPERIVVQSNPEVERALAKFRRKVERNKGRRITRSEAVRFAILEAAGI